MAGELGLLLSLWLGELPGSWPSDWRSAGACLVGGRLPRGAAALGDQRSRCPCRDRLSGALRHSQSNSPLAAGSPLRRACSAQHRRRLAARPRHVTDRQPFARTSRRRPRGRSIAPSRLPPQAVSPRTPHSGARSPSRAGSTARAAKEFAAFLEQFPSSSVRVKHACCSPAAPRCWRCRRCREAIPACVDRCHRTRS